MEVPLEELEPLFDYSRVQPIDFISLDDDSPVTSPVSSSTKRHRSSIPADGKGRETCNIVNVEANDERKEDNEEDWLPPPPPKVPGSSLGFTEDNFLQELRLQKQELASVAHSRDVVLKMVIESARREINSSRRSDLESEGEPLKPQVVRQKIIITIQDKAGQKQFRVYKDDKFERLFKMYAERAKINLESLVFCFDGEKIGPSASPDSLGMEDDDMIEVHVKSSH